MNTETIEKAAIDIIMKYPFAAKHQFCCTNGRLRIAFIDGARWRINSVWHDIDNELPECGKHVVNEDWFDFIADDEKDMERILKQYPFKHWAYIDDLLPDRKEDR